MPRIKFQNNLQVKFLNDVRETLKLNWPELAKSLEINPRTLSDWKRNIYTLPEKVFKRCVTLSGGRIKVPPYKTLPDFWSTEKARKKSWEVMKQKYGGMHPETLRKAQNAVRIDRKRDPEKYSHRKNILEPREGLRLAEFFGIVLGDGGISDRQVIISLHRENDKDYVSFVCNLVEELFGLKPSVCRWTTKTHQNEVEVVISRTDLVEFLEKKGLSRGNKVTKQAKVPSWIEKDVGFSVAALRGLIDTDGGVYFHKHMTNDCRCFNIGLTFTNSSVPLLRFVEKTLSHLGFAPKVSHRRRDIFLYREPEVLKYIEEVGFHNPYHPRRVKHFLTEKKGGVWRIG